MEKQVKDTWLKALRSGEYTQAKEVLASDQGYCCLGVLLKVTGNLSEEPVMDTFMGYNTGQDYTTLFADETGNVEFPAGSVLDKLGLDEDIASELAEYNDEGGSFEAIADMIEVRVE